MHLREKLVRNFPKRVTFPASALWTPHNILTKVDLPALFAPISTVIVVDGNLGQPFSIWLGPKICQYPNLAS